jgi:protein SCO1/2
MQLKLFLSLKRNSRDSRFHRVLLLLFLLAAAASAPAQMGKKEVAIGNNANVLPPQLQNVMVEQRLNEQLPPGLEFKDDYGGSVRLGGYFGKKPLVLALVYYECPMLCTEVLNGLTSALGVLKFDVGKEFDVLTVSFDPREGPELAARKKKAYLDRYGRPGAEHGWHFLTGPKESIDALTKAVGFHYQWDSNLQQFAHTTAVMVVTPEGKLSRYFYGVEYSPKDLRLGLIEASENKIGNLADQVLLYCYHYDPRTGKYGAVVTNIVRLAGAATVLILGGFLIVMFRREPKHKRAGAGQ